jgi:tRNA(fMet)-specific endonuclease VapC
MILLDTDHLSVLSDQLHGRNARLVARLYACGDPTILPTVVSLEEQMRGWLAEVKRRRHVHDQVAIYLKLTELVEFYNQWRIVQFESTAADIFQDLRARKIRVATQDLKIASIALANGALLLSANLVDFQRVPGLRVEDWLYGSES